MEEERDYYKKEYEVFKVVRKFLSFVRVIFIKVGFRLNIFVCFYDVIFIWING